MSVDPVVQDEERESNHEEILDLMGATADPCTLLRRGGPSSRPILDPRFLGVNGLLVRHESVLFVDGPDVPEPSNVSRLSQSVVPADPVGDFLEEIDIEDLCTRWNREDCLVSRAFRRSLGRQLRCSMKRSVARLERWYVGLGSLPGTTQQHYSNLWNRVVDELSELNAPWVSELLTRLEQIDPDPPEPSISLTTEVEHPNFRQYRHIDKAVRPKAHVRHAKKNPRKDKKHTSAKVLVHKGVPAFG